VRLAAIFLSLFTVIAQQAVPVRPDQPPRDVVPRPDPVGTGVIRGRVVAADTGSPIRRAMVNLMPVMTGPPPLPPSGQSGGRGTSPAGTAVMGAVITGLPAGVGSTSTIVSLGTGPTLLRPRQATTDAQGNFEFTGLPAGSYRIMANTGQYSAQYLAMAYGAKKPSAPYSSDPGQAIQLSDGQTFSKAIIPLPRGAVIAGRVTDETGEPMARVMVSTLMYPAGSTRPQRFGSSAQTDDLGQFRLFGMAPGEYVVMAEARSNTFVPPNAEAPREEESTGYLTTYYPGKADEATAVRVRARAGAEAGGIEIRMVQGRLFRVSGFVTDSLGQPLARTSGQLMRRESGGMNYGSGFSTDEQGQFRMQNIAPGTYRIIVRQMRPAALSPGANMQMEMGEFANVPVTINADIDNLAIVTGPGTTITGTIVFEQEPPSPMPKEMRVMATPGNPEDMMGMSSPQPALVTPELTFTLKGLAGEYLLRASAPNQAIKSITANGEDITDTPHAFKSNERITITFTSRLSSLEGTVTDAKGQPTTEAALIMFPEDKASWRSSSMRVRRAMVYAGGQFRMIALLPGRYYIAAVPRERLNVSGPGMDAAYFEQLAKEATLITLGEDEQRHVDLKVTGGGEG
jgi:protocatechuate 3,4-dioxygenase beta subunit